MILVAGDGVEPPTPAFSDSYSQCFQQLQGLLWDC